MGGMNNATVQQSKKQRTAGVRLAWFLQVWAGNGLNMAEKVQPPYTCT
jgi:hypothetical protein